jgi:hypothetical protein
MYRIITARPTIGFFSHFFQILSSLLKNESKEKPEKLIIYFNKLFIYWSKDGYRGRKNAWEYYFKQPYPDMPPAPEVVGICEEELGDAEVPKLKELTTPGKFAFSSSYWWWFVGKYGLLSDKFRKDCSGAVKRYIHLQDDVQETYDKLKERLIGGREVLAVQFRGTDKPPEIMACITKRIPPLEDYFKAADEYIEKHPKSDILMTTDSVPALGAFVQRYGKRVIHTDFARSDTKHAVHLHAAPHHGEEVLMDVLLCADCDFFIHGISNVSAGTLAFNADLPHRDMYYWVDADKYYADSLELEKKRPGRGMKREFPVQ